MSETDQNQEIVLDTKPKPFVFVLMPFDEAFTDVYQLGIKTACEEAGAYAERLDEQMFKESMLQRIYNQIAKADVVVADMTGRNPNVFYEVGYAHALGKVVILLTKEKEDIPFDLRHYRHIVYENVTGLLPELEKAVRWGVMTASSRRPLKPPIEVYYENRLLVGKPNFAVKPEGAGGDLLRFVLTYTNTDEVNVVQCRMALWTSSIFSTCWWDEKRHKSPSHDASQLRPVIHPTGQHIFTCPIRMSLLPAEWRADAVFLKIQTPHHEPVSLCAVHDMIIRVSTESSSYSYPFTITITGDKQE